MPLPSNAKRPLLLVFPCAHAANYQRCLLIAKYLRHLFDIQFLYTDRFAPLVYQNGFDTFSGNFFPIQQPINGKKEKGGYEENLELMFLEQVEILETLQPVLIIADGASTLGMAAEFTGIPLITLINGYQSPYFAHKPAYHELLSTHEPYRHIREKYGLRLKHSYQEELEGELNWICDLPELFPQKELPFHYDLIGPLIEIEKSPKPAFIPKLSTFKKTILIDLDDTELVNWPEILGATVHQDYNLAVRTTNKNKMHLLQMRMLCFADTSHLYFQADMLVCNTASMVYKALFYGLPILFIRQAAHQEKIIEALEHWQIGTSWNKIANSPDKIALEFWINNMYADAHRTLQYKTKAALTSLENKLLQSISLHFPFIGNQTVSLTK